MPQHSNTKSLDRSLPLFLTIWLPIIVLVAQVIAERIFDTEDVGKLLNENGLYEVMQFIIISIAFFIAISNIILFQKYKKHLLTLWSMLAALCCFYVAGEEISWGQHFIGWETSSEWSKINDQGETNFHNTSSWLDQKPRLLLLLGIVVGGLILPLIQMKKSLSLPAFMRPLLPSKELIFIALCVVIPQLAEKIGEAFGIALFIRFSEIQELYMFYYIALYLWMLKSIDKS